MTVDPPSSTLILLTFTSCCKVSFPRTWMQKLPAGPVRLALCRWKWNMSLDRTSSTELLWTYRTKLLSMSLWVKELAFCCLLIGSHRQVDSFFGLYFTWSSSQPHLGEVIMLYIRTGSWFSNVVVALRCLVCNTALVPSTTKRHLLAIRLMWAWWGLSKTVSVHNVCVVHAHGIWEPLSGNSQQQTVLACYQADLLPSNSPHHTLLHQIHSTTHQIYITSWTVSLICTKHKRKASTQEVYCIQICNI